MVMGTDGTRSITNFYRCEGLVIRPVGNQGMVIGDMNGDGALTITDVSILVNIVLSTKEMSEQDILRGDMNGDGALTISDITKLVDIVLGNQ